MLLSFGRCRHKGDVIKAIVYTKYGQPGVLELKEVEKPTPKDNEVLVKVRASTVTPMDYRFRSGKRFLARLASGLLKPKAGYSILGVELAGEVEAVGKNVKLIKQGDQVYGGGRYGAHAEYACMPEDMVTIKPSNMTYEEAATVHFAAGSALLFLRDLGRIQSGHKIVINGASGGVGTFAVQLAKHFGAEVTGVCRAADLELVRSLGAVKVIDYAKEDFTKSGQTYDIIFDVVGKRTFSECKRSLNQKGIYLNMVANVLLITQMLWTSMIGSKKAKFALPIIRQMLCTSMIGSRKAKFALPIIRLEDLVFLKGLIEAGKMRTVIDRTYPLEQAAEAHRYTENGYSKGKVVIIV
ncbi:NAD(P)-dependent alcohol dehydrogenase [Chloroflexota bacterium]